MIIIDTTMTMNYYYYTYEHPAHSYCDKQLPCSNSATVVEVDQNCAPKCNENIQKESNSEKQKRN